jgi:hypothetical protein
MAPTSTLRFLTLLLLGAVAGACAAAQPGRKGTARKVVFVAGPASHGYGAHEHYAGCMLLARLLRRNVPAFETAVHRGGWPKDPTVFDGADAIVIDCDGGSGHVVMKHLDQVDALMKKGVGLACLHYAVVVPKGRPGDLLKNWIGGYFETNWSVNPFWVAEFKQFPKHPIARGVRPFTIKDEWYYHMRFQSDMKGVTPVLTAVPPDETRRRPDSAYGGNPHVRARMGMPEHVAWAYERPGGGRGFGFTGVHWHWNWAHDDFRRLVLNAVVWIAGADVPPGGVPSKRPTLDELQAIIDKPKPKNWRPEPVREMIDAFNR